VEVKAEDFLTVTRHNFGCERGPWTCGCLRKIIELGSRLTKLKPIYKVCCWSIFFLVRSSIFISLLKDMISNYIFYGGKLKRPASDEAGLFNCDFSYPDNDYSSSGVSSDRSRLMSVAIL
jgi:hypothetical protein